MESVLLKRRAARDAECLGHAEADYRAFVRRHAPHTNTAFDYQYFCHVGTTDLRTVELPAVLIGPLPEPPGGFEGVRLALGDAGPFYVLVTDESASALTHSLGPRLEVTFKAFPAGKVPHTLEVRGLMYERCAAPS